MIKRQLELLVGDNAFHGISHLSQQRARERSTKENPSDVKHAAELVRLSLQNGATGFMFSVSETTLSILKALGQDEKPDLYAIVPYAYEYVRLATQVGGVSGLARRFSRQIMFSRNIFTVAPNLIGLIRANPLAFLKTYLVYEISRIKSATAKNKNLKSVLLHEVLTDMALALNLDQVFKFYVDFLYDLSIRPGFETRNFPYLVRKLKEWKIDFSRITIAASFNKIGFQMNPSQSECEKALRSVSNGEVIAMSILASGYLNPSEAIGYFENLSGITHIVVGVSKRQHAIETFKLLSQKLNRDADRYS